jgi:hypothetical protein
VRSPPSGGVGARRKQETVLLLHERMASHWKKNRCSRHGLTLA